MDGQRFDALTRRLSSRRSALGGIFAGLLLPLEASARGKSKDRKRKGKGKGKQRANAQAEPCWRAGACIVSKGSNVSQCDLAGYTALDPLDCTRCNLSRANLRGADLTGVNFTRANLSGACLVDADFTDATFANNTNLYNAIFCRTIMPDGSVNNSGCQSGTACCPTCDAGHLCPSGCCNTAIGTCGACPSGSICGGGTPGIPGICGCTPTTCEALGKACGSWPDGCGETLSCGACPANQSCCNGTCAPCPCNQVQLVNGTCVTPCSSAGPCGSSPCGCFIGPGYCGNTITFPEGLCPNGDIDCPLGQLCNTVNGRCRFACPAQP